jgi:hypothetical protein
MCVYNNNMAKTFYFGVSLYKDNMD